MAIFIFTENKITINSRMSEHLFLFLLLHYFTISLFISLGFLLKKNITSILISIRENLQPINKANLRIEIYFTLRNYCNLNQLLITTVKHDLK